MSRQEALFQSLAASGAAIITFIGVCHEAVGAKLFPWAPEMFGTFAWHGLGIVCILLGLLFWGATLRLIRFPVFSLALLTAAIGLVVFLFAAIVRYEFHVFALTVVLAGTGTAIFFRKASRLAALSEA